MMEARPLAAIAAGSLSATRDLMRGLRGLAPEHADSHQKGRHKHDVASILTESKEREWLRTPDQWASLKSISWTASNSSSLARSRRSQSSLSTSCSLQGGVMGSKLLTSAFVETLL